MIIAVRIAGTLSTKKVRRKFCMWLTGKLIRSGVAAAFVFAGGVFVFCATPAQTLNLASNAVVITDDEEESAVTARVARISFIRGEARVKRAGSDEWEKATLNLP